MFDPETAAIVSAAFGKLRAELNGTSYLGPRLLAWLERLAESSDLGAYFEHPYAYPLLQLPLWASRDGAGEADHEFLANVTLSNLCGYYFIRLLDDIMDADSTTDRQLLACATFLQIHIQRPYQRYFPAEHPFWDVFSAICTLTADVTVRDAEFASVSADDFRLVASQKVCGAKIPLAAVCYHVRRPDLIPAWFRFVDRLGEPHQMLNDLMGWYKDAQHANPTYLLSEAERRKSSTEPAAAWIVRSGFDWGLGRVESWLEDAAEAAPLDNPQALGFIQERLATLQHVRETIEPGLKALQLVLG